MLSRGCGFRFVVVVARCFVVFLAGSAPSPRPPPPLRGAGV